KMNNKLRTRLLLILFIFGLGIYSLWPTIKYQLLSDTEKNNLSKNEVEYLEKNTIKQGLDLKGGIYIVLEVDLPQLVNNLANNKDKKFDIFINDLKDGYTNNSVDFFELFDSKATDQDLKLPRYFITYGKTKNQIIEQLKFQADDSINRIIEIIQNRVDQFGVSEPTIQKQGNDRVIIELAGIQDSERARGLLQSTALLELMIVKDVESTNTIIRQIDNLSYSNNQIGIRSQNEDATNAGDLFSSDNEVSDLQFSSLLIGIGSDLAIDKENLEQFNNILSQENIKQLLEATGSNFLFSNSSRTFLNDFGEEEEVYIVYHLVNNAELTGGVIENAQVRLSQSGVTAGQPLVQMEMNSAGSREWARITGANIKKRIAIVLDKKVHMAPVINSQIFGGSTVIEGLDSVEEAEDVAIVLRAGALPVPVTIIDQKIVGPSLGADSVQQGTTSILIGLVLVVLFIIFYYRMSGFIASFSLIWTLILLLGILALLQATLTLPGIAGLILTVGMSIDANVIIFERIREELRKGKTVRSAIDSGYQRAITTIVDANLTTGIAAGVLYQYGTGPIKGFATVLFWGIVVSMFTAIIVTRFLFDFTTSRRNVEKLSI
ncbi:MAG: protein translocase subunit SecD, partial [Candidatus Neomarinimicrobiota bacterium]|nr:protein translocase subunit SecD [Candidatus Neomarinimicrobiota bacterium]